MGHHFVPQRYLRNFDAPSRPGFIWLHDKRGGAARSVSITKVAQAKGFYSSETEAFLAHHVETPGNAVIRKLTSDMAITAVERLQLAYYVGVMLKRTPSRRRLSSEMIPGVIADVVASIREQLKATAAAVQAAEEVDALRYDLNMAARWRGDSITVCGNLPYHIAAPLLFRVIDARESV